MTDSTHGEHFAHLAAEFINKESNRQSLITVTRGEVTSDGKRAKIFFTVLPESAEAVALDFLERHLSEFRRFVKGQSRSRIIPLFEFVVDIGEKNRQELDTLS